MTFSHGDIASHRQRYQMIRELEEDVGRPIGVMRLEYHLLALAREDLNQLHAAVAEPHVRTNTIYVTAPTLNSTASRCGC